MLNRWSVLTLLCGALAGYALGGSSVEAQNEPVPFAVGDTVTLWYGNEHVSAAAGNSVECVVAEIRGTYVKCGPASRLAGRARVERWFALQYVVLITKNEN